MLDVLDDDYETQGHVWDVEVTDTYGGEANYSWVKRHEIVMPSKATDYQIIRAAKREAGWNGLRCKVERYGDSYTLRPYKTCMVMFIQWRD